MHIRNPVAVRCSVQPRRRWHSRLPVQRGGAGHSDDVRQRCHAAEPSALIGTATYSSANSPPVSLMVLTHACLMTAGWASTRFCKDYPSHERTCVKCHGSQAVCRKPSSNRTVRRIGACVTPSRVRDPQDHSKYAALVGISLPLIGSTGHLRVDSVCRAHRMRRFVAPEDAKTAAAIRHMLRLPLLARVQPAEHGSSRIQRQAPHLPPDCRREPQLACTFATM
jgi:hypothetical protein